MPTKRLAKLTQAAAIVLVSALALVWHPQSVTGTLAEAPALAEPVPGGPGFYALSATAFRNTSGTGANLWLEPMPLLCNQGASGYWRAPLNLPHGATVTRFVAFYVDSDSGTDMIVDVEVWLQESSLDSGTVSNMAYVRSEGVVDGIRHSATISIAQAVINNQSNVYNALLFLPGGADDHLCLAGIRVDYDRRAALPAVIRNN